MDHFIDMKKSFQDTWNDFMNTKPSHSEITKGLFSVYNLTHCNGGNTTVENMDFLIQLLDAHGYQAPALADHVKHPNSLTYMVLSIALKQPYVLTERHRPHFQAMKAFVHGIERHKAQQHKESQFLQSLEEFKQYGFLNKHVLTM